MRIYCISVTSRVCTSVLLLGISSIARWPMAFNTSLEDKKSNSISNLALKVLQKCIVDYITDKSDNMISSHNLKNKNTK